MPHKYREYYNGQYGVKGVPLDVLFKGKAALKPEFEVNILNIFRKGMERLLIANGYARLSIARSLSITATPTLIKEHKGVDDRRLIIYNNDTLGAAVLTISNDPSVTTGYPLLANKEFEIIMVHNDKIYGAASTGTIDTRILEYTPVSL